MLTHDVDLNEVLQNQLSQTNNSINALVSRASKFTRVQARAIYYFLLYTRAESGDDFLSNEANLAIQRYWFQFA
ncbi:MAG: hypothetical protein EOO60_09780 [Hymenobacter sp.]|nr:MAG: hypothetical protein EOO60_09780 [Hymenobacter sp.]